MIGWQQDLLQEENRAEIKRQPHKRWGLVETVFVSAWALVAAGAKPVRRLFKAVTPRNEQRRNRVANSLVEHSLGAGHREKKESEAYPRQVPCLLSK